MELKDLILDQLAALKGERKFDAYIMYPGAPSGEIRAHCESTINRLLDTLMRGLPKQSDTVFVLSAFKSHLDGLSSGELIQMKSPNKCIKYARVACPIRKSEALLLSAYARRSSENN